MLPVNTKLPEPRRGGHLHFSGDVPPEMPLDRQARRHQLVISGLSRYSSVSSPTQDRQFSKTIIGVLLISVVPKNNTARTLLHSMSDGKRIAIFPAAGKLGTSVYTHLAKLVPPRQLILISRHPEKISRELTDAGAEVRAGDYDAPESLDGVFKGASYLFLVSYPSIQIDHRFEAHQRAVNAALECSPGIEHIFYTSLAFGGDGLPASKAHVMQAHLKTEAWLKSLVQSRPSLTFTSIREGIVSTSKPSIGCTGCQYWERQDVSPGRAGSPRSSSTASSLWSQPISYRVCPYSG